MCGVAFFGSEFGGTHRRLWFYEVLGQRPWVDNGVIRMQFRRVCCPGFVVLGVDNCGGVYYMHSSNTAVLLTTAAVCAGVEEEKERISKKRFSLLTTFFPPDNSITQTNDKY